MNIGIIGSGIVGQVLAKAFATEGNQVMLGTRNTSKEEVVNFQKEHPHIRIGNFEQTASFGSLLVLAVSGGAVLEALSIAGISNFDSKTVIDATNPIAAAPPVHGVLKFFTDYNESLMEKIQRLVPQAKLVKAFNSVGHAYMYKPQFEGGKPTMFICGNDEEAKNTVAELLHAFGWESEDMGMVEAARAIEPLCILWCIPGMLRNQWRHAFKLLKA